MLGVAQKWQETLSELTSREGSMEGVYDAHASISLAVTQVFRVDGVGPQRFGSRQNSRVPIGDRESLGLLDRDPH